MFRSVLLCVIVTSVVYGSPMAPPSPPSEYHVIVVGLGISGTISAATLAKAGKHVLALEAQDRIGGRVYTEKFGGGIVELGAEWIHGTEDSATYDLALQNNISLISDSLDMQTYNSNGTVDAGTVSELLGYAMTLMDQPPAEPEPLGQFVTRNLRAHMETHHPILLSDADFMGNMLSLLDQIMNNYEASNSWNDVSTASQYDTLEGDQHMSWHKLGYRTLFDIVLNTYKNKPGIPNLTTQLNTEVVLIKWPRDSTGPVEVTTKDGTVYKADTVIVTVSLGVLKERLITMKFNKSIVEEDVKKSAMRSTPRFVIQSKIAVSAIIRDVEETEHTYLFNPPLPKEKSDAIQIISMGVMDKIELLFKEAWWSPQPHFFSFLWRNEEKNLVTKRDEWTTKIWGATAPQSHGKVLTLWTSGETAKLVETLPAEEVKSKLVELLRKFMGASFDVTEPEDMIRSMWYSNPFTRGSYSFDSIAAPAHPTARIDLAAPLTDASHRPRVLFAGEATHPNRFSTVHGALETGKREAERLLIVPSKL